MQFPKLKAEVISDDDESTECEILMSLESEKIIKDNFTEAVYNKNVNFFLRQCPTFLGVVIVKQNPKKVFSNKRQEENRLSYNYFACFSYTNVIIVHSIEEIHFFEK